MFENLTLFPIIFVTTIFFIAELAFIKTASPKFTVAAAPEPPPPTKVAKQKL